MPATLPHSLAGELPFDAAQRLPPRVAAYVRDRFHAEIESVESLGRPEAGKGFGYGTVLRLHLSGGHYESIVLHVARRGGFGHDGLADAAVEAIVPFETFNDLSGHARALDVGVIDDRGALESIARIRDFFLVTAYAEGEPYAHDLERIAKTGKADDEDLARADRLAEHIAQVHREKKSAAELWRRRLRDLVGHHECIAGLVDSYRGYVEPDPAVLRSIEHWALDWRHRVENRSERLCRVHGDFHPWNVLFHGSGFGRRLTLLDASRGAFGEAADDVAAMAINYLFFALRVDQGPRGELAQLFTRFIGRYMEVSDDAGVLDMLPPYFVWRALVVASPVWYPDLDPRVRARIFEIVQEIQRTDRVPVLDIDFLFARVDGVH